MASSNGLTIRQAGITSGPISISLVGLVVNLRRKMNEPGFDMMKMAYETGIDHQAIYNFKRGATASPRVETLEKMIGYLTPEVRIIAPRDDEMKPAAE